MCIRDRDRDGVTTLTLNRPTQFNSLSEEMLVDLQAALDAIAADASVRAVVIAGAGKAFCSGHDLKQMRAKMCIRDRAYVQIEDGLVGESFLHIPCPCLLYTSRCV